MNHKSSRNYLLIYANLPRGGAKLTQKLLFRDIIKTHNAKYVTEPKYKINNLAGYLFTSLIVSPSIQKRIILRNSHNLLIAYQSWLVKSPSILRYAHIKPIYICHEPPLEFYDTKRIRLHSLKEIIMNIIRLPIKWLDKYNVTKSKPIIIANSKYEKMLIDKVYKTQSTVIYPGIEVNKYLPRNHDENTNNQVIIVGAINKYKRQEFAVDVIGNIDKSIRPTLLLVGNGSDKKYVTKITRKARLLGVRIIIKINISERAFIYSPVSEPFGIVIEEAVASGLPILSYKLGGGYAEVIDKSNGPIFNNLVPDEWAKELAKILTDSDLRKQYRNNNMSYAKTNFRVEDTNKQIISVVNSCL
ncbi:MAG: Glycosyltransferase, family 4 [Microgenomates group bacterium GW2011_GWC2_46_7]|nr:MAG: Glycosyltransferase, family 4 [Microgenomates group bacterium GW2011_GWC2_46_7]